jgi:molecular chaperone HscB
VTTPCWSCQADTGGAAFCPACGKIAQRAPGATFFELFDLPARHALDVGALERRYRELSLKLHPDRFAQASPRERRLSLEATSALNEAYRVLKDPVRRAFYLLRLLGVDLENEAAAERARMPMEFLEEVMALREALEDARAAKDPDTVRPMASDVQRKNKAALASAVQALDAGDREIATHALGRVRYYQRFLEEVEATEEELLT